MRATLLAKSTKSCARGIAGAEAGPMIDTTYGRISRIDSEDVSSARFAMSGEFDLYNKPQLAEALECAVACPWVTLDFTRTRFIDASILGLLASIARRRLQLGAAQVRIVNTRAGVHRLFDICEMSGIFEMYSEPAIAGLISA